MQVTTETFGQVVVAHTPDEITEDTAGELLGKLEQPIAAGQVNLVLEMDRSESYDSAGLEALLDLQDRVRQAGGNVKISGLRDPGRKIFELTRLDHRFDLFESVIDAVESFG